MERVNAELESKKRSIERLQVSVVAGAGFAGFLPRCVGLKPSLRGPRQVKILIHSTEHKNPRSFADGGFLFGCGSRICHFCPSAVGLRPP